MTIENHIENLKKLKSFHNGSYGVDIDRAVQALKQEQKMVHRETLEQVMWERDVAITQLKELGYGLGAKIKTDKNAISRQEVIDACEQSINIMEAVDRIMDLPSIKPQEPKTGHWKRNETIRLTYCSECGFGQHIDEFRTYNYCPNCGVCMKDCRTLDEFIEDSKESEE